MTYIYQKPNWPSLHWNSELLSAPLARVRHQQGQLLGRMLSMGFGDQTEASLEALAIEVLKSNAIEGEQLDSTEVRSSLAKQLGIPQAGLVTPSRHIDGIVSMTLDATENWQQPLTEERLLKWHHALFTDQTSQLKRIGVGHWRREENEPMQVVSGPIGREKIHFEAPAATQIEQEMQQFFDWYNHCENVDPILQAGVAHFWFVTIHPFEDGNGRIARAIADSCLAKADNSKHRFYSMSAQIEKERKDYYNILERCQKGGLDISEWLSWFLACLERAIDNSGDTLKNVLYKAALWQRLANKPVNNRQRQILARLLNDFKGKLSTKKYARLAKCSHDTALRDIKMLIDYGVLEKSAETGRSTHYRLITLDTQNNKQTN